MKYKIGLFLVVLLGLGLRLYKLDSVPPGFNWDEVSHAYNAYSLIKTGADQWGNSWPIVNFRAYGDYPVPLNLYITIPFIYSLGLSVFASRLPHALMGTIVVILVYFLGKGVTKSRKVSLLTALLIAVSPWAIFTSREVLQANLSIFFVILAIAAFLNRDKNKWLLPLSFLSLILTLFSYHTTRIFSPMLMGLILLIYGKEFVNKLKRPTKDLMLSGLLLIIFWVLVPIILLNSDSRARSQFVFLIDQGAVNQIIDSRIKSNLPDVLNRAVNNRPVYFVRRATQNYLEYYLPEFLFLKGGSQYQFSLPDHGVMYPLNLFFYYIGLIWVIIQLIKSKDKRKWLLVLGWFLIAPVAASITKDRMAVTRSSPFLPLPQLLAAIGAITTLDWLVKKFKLCELCKFNLKIIYLGILAYFVYGYMNQYLNIYPRKYSWAWQYGYQQAVEYVKDNYDKYNQVFFTKKLGEPHEFVAFYWPWDPYDYQRKVQWDYHDGWYWVNGLDKFIFVNDWEIKDGVKCEIDQGKCLLISSPGNAPDSWIKIDSIPGLNGESVFEIYEK